MSFVRGSNSAFSSSNFFFSSSSSISRPSFVVLFNFLPSNSFSCCTAYSSTGSTMYKTSRPFFRGGLQLFALKLLQLLHGVLVHGVNHVQDLEALLPEIF